MRRHAHPAGARRRGDSGGAQAAHDLFVLESRFPDAYDTGTSSGSPRAQKDFVSLGFRTLRDPIAEALDHRRDFPYSNLK